MHILRKLSFPGCLFLSLTIPLLISGFRDSYNRTLTEMSPPKKLNLIPGPVLPFYLGTFSTEGWSSMLFLLARFFCPSLSLFPTLPLGPRNKLLRFILSPFQPLGAGRDWEKVRTGQRLAVASTAPHSGQGSSIGGLNTCCALPALCDPP